MLNLICAMAPSPPAPGNDGIPGLLPGPPGSVTDTKKIALDPAESSAIERQ